MVVTNVKRDRYNLEVLGTTYTILRRNTRDRSCQGSLYKSMG